MPAHSAAQAWVRYRSVLTGHPFSSLQRAPKDARHPVPWLIPSPTLPDNFQASPLLSKLQVFSPSPLTVDHLASYVTEKIHVIKIEIPHFPAVSTWLPAFVLISCPRTNTNLSSCTLFPPSFAYLRFYHQFSLPYWIIIMSTHMVIFLTVQNNPFFILFLLLLSHCSHYFYNKTPRKNTVYTITSGHPQIWPHLTTSHDTILVQCIIFLTWIVATICNLVPCFSSDPTFTLFSVQLPDNLVKTCQIMSFFCLKPSFTQKSYSEKRQHPHNDV